MANLSRICFFFFIFVGMKPCHYILMVCAISVACNSNKQVPEPAVPEDPRRVEGPSKELAAIDSLLWQRPDSALACLIPYFDTCCRDGVHTVSTYNHHYAHLLLAELLYKNDYAQTNRAKLRQAVGYFDSLYCRDAARHVSTCPTTAFLAARAHYINGVGYYEHDSVVPACKEYLKALEVMEEHFEEKELVGKKAKFMAYTYTRLADLFSDYYLHEQTIWFAQQSLHYYHKQDVPSWYSARMLEEIGSQYYMMRQIDSAENYYHRATDILHDTTLLLQRDITAHLIYLNYNKGIFDANTAKVKLHQLSLKSESDRERHSYLMYIGEILYHEQNYDSAWLFLNSVFQATSSVGLKRQAAEWLVGICKEQKRDSLILEYAEYLVPFANQEENQSMTKSQLTELYNTYWQTESDFQHRIKLKKISRMASAIVLGLIVLLLTISILFHINKLKKLNLESIIKTERYEHKIQQAALAGRLKHSNLALKIYEKESRAIKPSIGSAETGADNYEEETICRHILSVCFDEKNPIKSTVPISAYAPIALTDKQKMQLKDAAWRHHERIFEILKQQHPQLKEKDFFYCYLSLLGLDNIQIAALLQNSVSTTWDREKRLQRLLGINDKIAIALQGLITNYESGN
ncbi:MAG: hypothetical protein IJK78_05400 [Bacteroidales bacterium]|nr:hypothetical protein [Bacteroidales bacterium]